MDELNLKQLLEMRELCRKSGTPLEIVAEIMLRFMKITIDAEIARRQAAEAERPAGAAKPKK